MSVCAYACISVFLCVRVHVLRLLCRLAVIDSYTRKIAMRPNQIQEHLFPNLVANMRKTLLPLMREGLEAATATAEQQSGAHVPAATAADVGPDSGKHTRRVQAASL